MARDCGPVCPAYDIGVAPRGSQKKERGIRSAPLFSRCGYAQPIHRTAETEQDRIVNLPAWSNPCVSVSQHTMVSSVNPYNFDSTPMQFRLNHPRLGNSRGLSMRESNTRTLKPKKLTATMKRRALKLKVLPTKARNPQVSALVVSAPQPSGV
jgi:hypothetical protein